MLLIKKIVNTYSDSKIQRSAYNWKKNRSITPKNSYSVIVFPFFFRWPSIHTEWCVIISITRTTTYVIAGKLLNAHVTTSSHGDPIYPELNTKYSTNFRLAVSRVLFLLTNETLPFPLPLMQWMMIDGLTAWTHVIPFSVSNGRESWKKILDYCSSSNDATYKKKWTNWTWQKANIWSLCMHQWTTVLASIKKSIVHQQTKKWISGPHNNANLVGVACCFVWDY